MLNVAAKRALICTAATVWFIGAFSPFASAGTETEARRVHIEFETGAIWQSRNEIQIPDTIAGTRFSLADIQDGSPIVQRRVEARWHPARRHALRFVYQPLASLRSRSINCSRMTGSPPTSITAPFEIRRAPGLESRIELAAKPIADTRICPNEPRTGRIFLDLFSELSDKHAQILGLLDVRLPPHFLQKHAMCQHFP